MKRISALIGGAVLGVALLAACGGGSGSSAPNGPVPPAGTSAPGNTTQSFSVSDAVAIPTAAPGDTSVAVPLPADAASGASSSASFPVSGSVPPDTTVAATYSANGDATTPTLASNGRQTQSASRGTREDNATSGIKPLAYLKLQFSADVTLPQAPGFSFVVPGTFTTANGVTYWLGLFDPVHQAAGWQKSFEGPGTVSPAQTAGGKVATKFDFASNGKPISFVANQTYYLVLFALAPNTATPTPVPSAVPSNPPPETKPAPVIASPTALQFDTVTSSPQPVTFSEQGFAGPFTLYGNCTGIVNTSGASPTWTVTPVANGRCYIAGIGLHGASALVRVSVGPVPTEPPSPTPKPTASPRPSTSPTTHPSESPAPSHSPEPTHSPSPSPSPQTHPTEPPNPSPTPTATPTPGTSTTPK